MDKKQEGKRTTLTLSLSVDDKKALKKMAAERQVTVARMVHGWIVEKRDGEKQ